MPQDEEVDAFLKVIGDRSFELNRSVPIHLSGDEIVPYNAEWSLERTAVIERFTFVLCQPKGEPIATFSRVGRAAPILADQQVSGCLERLAWRDLSLRAERRVDIRMKG